LDLGIQDKVAVVLSGSKGLGLACASAFASEGARVAICSRTQKNLDAAKDSIMADSDQDIFTEVADVSKTDQLESFLANVNQNLGDIEILVINSGGPAPGAVSTSDWQAWESAIQLLLRSAHTAVSHVLPGMRAQQWGRIMVITSVSVKQPIAGLGLSTSVRAAVTGYIKTLAGEVASDGVTANCICPGFIHTERIDQLASMQAAAEGITAEEAIEKNMTAQVPIGRLGKPEELGAVAAFLASEQAAMITGSSIAVDGGLVKGLLG